MFLNSLVFVFVWNNLPTFSPRWPWRTEGKTEGSVHGNVSLTSQCQRYVPSVRGPPRAPEAHWVQFLPVKIDQTIHSLHIVSMEVGNRKKMRPYLFSLGTGFTFQALQPRISLMSRLQEQKGDEILIDVCAGELLCFKSFTHLQPQGSDWPQNPCFTRETLNVSRTQA